MTHLQTDDPSAAAGLRRALLRHVDRLETPDRANGSRSPSRAAAEPARAEPARPVDPVRARAKALAAAVKNDPACKGKAALALRLLADDEMAALPPSGLAKFLAMAPAVDPGADAEAAALSEMRAALARTSNSDITANDPAASAASQAANVWDLALAANGKA